MHPLFLLIYLYAVYKLLVHSQQLIIVLEVSKSAPVYANCIKDHNVKKPITVPNQQHKRKIGKIKSKPKPKR